MVILNQNLMTYLSWSHLLKMASFMEEPFSQNLANLCLAEMDILNQCMIYTLD